MFWEDASALLDGAGGGGSSTTGSGEPSLELQRWYEAHPPPALSQVPSHCTRPVKRADADTPPCFDAARFAESLKATSGGEDLDPEALMSFLFTLTDAAEIKGYLSEFLGMSAGVIKFADEFIDRKRFDAK